MTLLRKLLRYLLDRLDDEGNAPPTGQDDPIGDNLRAAIAADAEAMTANVETYQARVEAMIADFFARYGEFHVRRPS